jgi:hypothetical protein
MEGRRAAVEAAKREFSLLPGLQYAQQAAQEIARRAARLKEQATEKLRVTEGDLAQREGAAQLVADKATEVKKIILKNGNSSHILILKDGVRSPSRL